MSLPATVIVPREQRRLAGEYVVESYQALKDLSACRDNSYAACVFSGIAIIIRCNGNTLDANQEKRFFYGRGSGSSLEVHGCVLTRGEHSSVSVVCWRSKRLLLDSPPLFVIG